MDAGKLRHRVLLQQVTTGRDPKSGAEIKNAVDIARVWAGAEPISNRKIRTLDQQQVVETMLFTLRPRADIDTDWRVVLAGRVFTVRAADRTQADRVLITAEADTRHDRI